ncbi:MAG: S41 family peptidase [Tidjanibacter sp.]|nr:S41 family peptidase [Tidjanibacter sp.]
MKRGVKYVVVALLLGASVLLGGAAKDNTYRLGKSVEVLVNMLRTINLFYVDEVEPEKIMNAAAEGMTKILDPYTTYLPAESMDDFEVMTTGKYGGVGSLIRLEGDYVEFSGPYRNSPADKAGIRPGDKILSIEGESAKGMTTQQVSNRLKGDPGTKVRLTVGKFPTGEEVELKIERERIAIPGVPYFGMVSDSVGLISHQDFTEGCASDLRKAYEALEAQGMRSLILDYRGNGGGILQEAVGILSLFLPTGSEVVSTRSSREGGAENRVFRTEGVPLSTEMPIVVLTDRSSASAAEIVAGALQDNDRAVLVGERTYGKGLVQSTYPLGYGAYAKLTTSKYHLPSGRCIQAIDYAGHNEDGSVAFVPDSLIREFRTKAGRKVYDGGGVMPDVRMEPTYVATFTVVLYALGHIDDFLAEWCARHYDELEGRVVPVEYAFPDEGFEEFVAFMKDKKVEWESPTVRLWKQFKEAAEKERWRGDMDGQMEAIEANITNDTEDLIRLYEKEIRDLIENNIVQRYCYTDGSIAHSLHSDVEVAKALEILADKALYNEILSSRDTERK